MQVNENDRVKSIRKMKGLTQDEFGAKLGIQKSAVSKIERGECAVTRQVRMMISKAFDVREEWLRTGEGEQYVTRQATEELERFFSEVSFETPGFRRALLTILSRLTPGEWETMERKAWELMAEMKKTDP